MSAPRTVLHVAQPTVGGVGLLVHGLALLQAELGWRVVVACPPHGDLAGVGEGSTVEHVPWDAVRSPLKGVPGETRSLGRIVGSIDPDVVHLHSSKAGLDGRLAVRGARPTVFEPHGWSFLAVEGAVRALAVRWERWAAKRADVICCLSDRERELGEAEGVRATFEVIPNAVDLTRYPVAGGEQRDAARVRLGLEAVPTALCVGRIRHEKGVDVLLDAWPLVTSAVPGAQLALVGDGPDREALEARGVGGVVFAGERSDVADWIAAAEVVVVPSRWEGMSTVMLEALARARPVVSTDVSGARQVIGDEAGAVVPLEDAPALAGALVVRLHDPALAAREGAAGRAIVEASHDVHRRAERVLALYDEIIAARG